MQRWAFLVLAMVLSGCQRGDAPQAVDYQTLGELRVATRLDPLSYRGGAAADAGGYEHDLLLELGNELGVPVRFRVYASAARALDAVRDGDVHLAAAALGKNGNARRIQWTPPVRDLSLLVASSAALSGEISTLNDLAGRTVTARRGTLAAQRLRELQSTLPTLTIDLKTGESDAQLLAEVADGRIALVATNEAQLALAAALRPELESAIALPGVASMAWALSENAPQSLVDSLSKFIRQAHDDGLITRLEDRYLGPVRRLNEADITWFVERMQSRLPPFQPMFEAAAEETGVDWRLLAAMGYQESQWDPLAVSPTGVRGLMMLTDDTAARMGVQDRLDPAQSILGGAKYFSLMRESIADNVAEPDRTWMAIAAYNLGLGHLRGARQVANTMGHDNTTWVSMRRVLPMMSKPRFARRLRAGPARGGEAVIMTENVRAFYDILRRLGNSGDDAPTALSPSASVKAP